MRSFSLAFLVLAGLAVPAFAQSDRETERPVKDAAGAAAPVLPSRQERLESLFSTLKSATDEDAAKAAENDIITLWLESGSDTVDLMMSWVLAAMEEKDYGLALDYLDRMLILKPDYAEAWNKRATVHFLEDDYPKAIADIERALALEPRHFGALSGLGTIMRDIGDEDRALAAYKKALEIDPHLDTVKEAVTEIEGELAGQEI
jgi:tetratricopeptide (TPR) repeat protein